MNVSHRCRRVAELEMSPWLNRVFATILRVEVAVIRYGVSLPLGGSRLLVARKP
jgi:hypothetical protein